MNYKVLVLDIDGTLTNSQKKITEKTKEALERVQQAGTIVVLASGRPTHGVEPIAQEIGLDRFGGYILSYNGAKMIQAKTREVVYSQNIPAEWVPSLYQFAQQNQVSIISYHNSQIITEQPDNPYAQIEANVNKMQIKQVENFAEEIQYPVTKCIMLGDGDYLEQLEPKAVETFGDRLNIYRSEPYFLEIMPQHIDKAYSLGKLLEMLNLSREQMVACGDGFNDLSMIRFAGLGVAMANAQPVVKEAADYLAPSCDEDGVVKVIGTFFLNRN